ncbi:beta-galactosidase trimerization domain-containing protein [Paenibacillus sp. GCM10027628]|uniref:beta-galactosidase trimerization domain-containing protein n=1 Tax=Paenibacillus sp. GCM10027628 TaxID=3273413 RepID=UPI00362CBC43
MFSQFYVCSFILLIFISRMFNCAKKAIDAILHLARHNITHMLWDNGTRFDRTTYQWKDQDTYNITMAALKSRSSNAESDLRQERRAGPGRRNAHENDGKVLTSIKNGNPLLTILHSHDQYNALQIQPQAEGMDYFDNLKLYQRALTKLGVPIDVVNTTADLTGYRLIVAPSLFLLDERVADHLEDCVRNGATLIVTNRTGVKNMNNVCRMEPLPGPLAEAAGVYVSEYDPIGKDVHTIRAKNGKTYTCMQWCDILELSGGEPVAWYEDDFFAGRPAAAVHYFGSGKVYYLGMVAEESFYLDFFRETAAKVGASVFTSLPKGVQISVRKKREKRYLFLLNLSRKRQTVTLGQAYPSLLSERRVGPKLEMEPYAVEIVELAETGRFFES